MNLIMTSAICLIFSTISMLHAREPMEINFALGEDPMVDQKYLITEKLYTINIELQGSLKQPLKLDIDRSTYSDYNAIYSYPDSSYGEAIALGASLLKIENTPDMLTILSHEYGHAIFEHNVIAPLKKLLKLDDIGENWTPLITFRALTMPVNELFADLVANLYNDQLIGSATEVFGREAARDLNLNKKQMKKMDNIKFDSCRNYKGWYSHQRPFTLIDRNKQLEGHVILCPAARTIWKKINEKDEDRTTTLVKLSKIFHEFLEELLTSDQALHKLYRNKFKFNHDLIKFVSDRY